VAVDVGGEPPNGVSEGVNVGLGVEVFDGVGVIVGVFVMVEVGVRVSGTNSVAVGLKVAVELGIGEGRATVPDESGFPSGAADCDALVTDGLMGINEANGPTLASSKKLGKAAALEE